MKNQALFSSKDKSKKKNVICCNFRLALQGLKVGSWSFEDFIILLICFLNCRKVLFTKT